MEYADDDSDAGQEFSTPPTGNPNMSLDLIDEETDPNTVGGSSEKDAKGACCFTCHGQKAARHFGHKEDEFPHPVDADTGGEGPWKPLVTCWVHCRLWITLPAMFLQNTFCPHFECNLNIYPQCDH